MFFFFFSFAFCYIDCKNQISMKEFNVGGFYNFTLDKGKWKYLLGVFNKSVAPSLRLQYQVSTTGPAKFYMDDINKCPMLGDPIIIQTQGKTINQTAVTPHNPPNYLFTIGVYSESDNNQIILQIIHLLPPPPRKRNIYDFINYVKLHIKPFIKFIILIIVCSIGSFFISNYIMSKLDQTEKKNHKFIKQMNKTAKGRKKIH